MYQMVTKHYAQKILTHRLMDNIIKSPKELMAQINKPSEHFNTKLYSGNGSTQSITSVGFKPDWIWIKARSGTYSTQHII